MIPELKSFTELKKNLKKPVDGLKLVRVALLSDSASQFITQALRGLGIENHLNYQVYEADYNQIDRQIFDPGSDLYEYKPDFIIILRSSERLIKTFYKLPVAEKEKFAESQAAYMDSLYGQIGARLKASVICNSFPEINDGAFGNFSSKVKSSFPNQVKKLNTALMDLSAERKNFFLADLSSLAAKIGYHDFFDPKMYINADMVYSIDALPFVARQLHHIIQAIRGTFNKCLILDLDNTIWGGIIGDDGLEGIQIGGLGMGKAFSELQLWVKELRRRGIIIAVCSKNTEEIAKEPFLRHPEMILKLDDIAVFVANWENKVDNIRYIQGILNIGFDSMVFLDDNPFEREMVSKAITGITVPNLPEDPSEYLPYLRGLNLFETASYTAEDEQRTRQYQEEAKRNILQKTFANEHEFLQSLNMQCEAKPFDAFTIPRIAQLSQRSNQFNLRTVRYTEEEIKIIAGSADHYTISFSLNDIYGDYGLIAFVILQKKDELTLFIDSWIMSCRVLKRGMETYTLNKIAALAQEHGFRKITGEYIPTKKNGLVSDHFQKLGFRQAENDFWELDLSEYDEKPVPINPK